MFRVLKSRNLLTASATVTIAGIVLVAATAALADPAARTARLTDAQYIQAAACAAWAPVAVGDETLADRIEAEARGRLPGVTSRARTARDNAARQARRAAGDTLARQQLTARFEADCAVYVTPAGAGGGVATAN